VPEIDAFLADIVEVCKKHSLWLRHEDEKGAFEVDVESTEDWLMVAQDGRGKYQQIANRILKRMHKAFSAKQADA
jgi:hypothetical protein